MTVFVTITLNQIEPSRITKESSMKMPTPAGKPHCIRIEYYRDRELRGAWNIYPKDRSILQRSYVAYIPL